MDRNDKELPSIRIPITQSLSKKLEVHLRELTKNKGDASLGWEMWLDLYTHCNSEILGLVRK